MRLFLVAEPRVYREGLARALAYEEDVELVGASAWHADVAARIGSAAADVLLVDLAAHEAFRLVEEVASAGAGPRVVGLAARDSESDVIAWIEAGVSAFVPAEGSFAELLAALAGVWRGESVLPPQVATTLIRRVRSIAHAQPIQDGAPLTAREQEIVRLVAHGLTNKEIAQRLSIQVSTVKNHVHHILVKLEVDRRADAAAKVRAAPYGSIAPARD
jgi:two-component system, NarL family, nitrate/nitrite response regulator NarL